MQFCVKMRLAVPDDVSLVCCDANTLFEWCQPEISHIGWEIGPVVRRVVRWANNISMGLEDLRSTNTRCVIVEGGTIGPVHP